MHAARQSGWVHRKTLDWFAANRLLAEGAPGGRGGGGGGPQ